MKKDALDRYRKLYNKDPEHLDDCQEFINLFDDTVNNPYLYFTSEGCAATFTYDNRKFNLEYFVPDEEDEDIKYDCFLSCHIDDIMYIVNVKFEDGLHNAIEKLYKNTGLE